MQSLERNKQTVWYSLYLGKTDVVDTDGQLTGEKQLSFSNVVKMKANVSAARGTADIEQFGVNTDYSRTITTTDMNCPINEHSRIWFDTLPTNPHNYEVVTVAKSLNSITIAIKEVKVSV